MRARTHIQALTRQGQSGAEPLLKFDFSDASRLWQEPAATTPVSAIANPVGRCQSLYGRRLAEQPTLTARPLFGRVPVGGGRNLVWMLGLSSENLSSGWVFANGTVTTTTDSPPTFALRKNKFVASSGQIGAFGRYLAFEAMKVKVGDRVGFSFVLSKDAFRYAFLWYDNAAGGGYTVELDFDTGASRLTRNNAGSNFSGFVFDVEPDYEGNTGWFRVSMSAIIGTGTTVNPRVYSAGVPWTTGDRGTEYIEGDGVSGVWVTAVQPEILLAGADVASDYQRVVSTTDITEPGIDPAYHARFDLGDDLLPASIDLPAITGGQIVIASPHGIWIDDFDHAGGAFSFGPTTYTGGPSGIISALFQQRISGISIFEQPMTAVQRYDEISYWMSRGAGWPWKLSDELVVNGEFDSDIAGWVKRFGSAAVSISWDAQRLRFERVASGFEGVQQAGIAQAGGIYLMACNYENDAVAKSLAFLLGNTTGIFGSIPTGSSGVARAIGTSPATGDFGVYSQSNAGSGVLLLDNMSLRSLTPDTEALS